MRLPMSSQQIFSWIVLCLKANLTMVSTHLPAPGLSLRYHLGMLSVPTSAFGRFGICSSSIWRPRCSAESTRMILLFKLN